MKGFKMKMDGFKREMVLFALSAVAGLVAAFICFMINNALGPKIVFGYVKPEAVTFLLVALSCELGFHLCELCLYLRETPLNICGKKPKTKAS